MYASNQTLVACHYQPRGKRELARRSVVDIEQPRLFFQDGADIQLNDQVTTVTVATGRTFEIVSITKWDGYHVECEIEEVG